MSAILLTSIIFVVLALLFFFQEKIVFIFLGVIVFCYLFGWIDEKTIVENATNQAIITLMLIILIASAIQKTRILRSVSNFLFDNSEKKTLLKVMLISAISSAFLNNTAIVAILIKAVKSNKNIIASRILLPISYAAVIGGTLTLIGTSTNMVVSSMYAGITNTNGLSFFDFTAVGAIVLCISLIAIFFSAKTLPTINSNSRDKNQYFISTSVTGSSLVGKSLYKSGLITLNEFSLEKIIQENGNSVALDPDYKIHAKDTLIFLGNIKNILVLSHFHDLKLSYMSDDLGIKRLHEVIVRDKSIAVDKTGREINFKRLFNASIVAIKQESGKLHSRMRDLKLKAGDIIILATSQDFTKNKTFINNFSIIQQIKPIETLCGWKEALTSFGFIGAIIFSLVTRTDLFNSMFMLFIILFITKCLTVDDIKNNFPTAIWIIITSSLCLASSMESTGLSTFITDFAAMHLANHSHIIIFISIFIITMILTELITNNAAAALMFPVAYNIAIGSNMNIFPVVLGVAFAASASFLTPHGYQTNLMVVNAAKYRLKDLFKAGIPVSITYVISCILAIIVIYPL